VELNEVEEKATYVVVIIMEKKDYESKKKIKKGPLMRKADTLQSKYWREKIGKCEKCGSKENLQLAHINTRDIRGLRYDRRNLLVLCARCHTWGHDFPLRFSEVVRSIKGELVYKFLKAYKIVAGISTVEFYQKVIKYYQDKIKTL
jgi:5-methylcytosine-specific restriction endonuclease McrA